ncbi:putidacin L1 family lectin-like bacteriocin [Pseudomonas sp. TH04]|uniref:putidacin L1 family lectin-like bacteriocin n=1 Tax=Pseudomonas sp. TH04 TaxID=2796370 RepID=UPI0019144260|nr:putidacin L1 family lectin-like bacteriocin [Pseudomonas sp. TH04]MBK5543289.1 putidacin L1 family lectin-like bacteriocin [Pseudomonas sp. TH04]
MAFSVAPFTNNGSSVLPPRTIMRQGQYLESPDKRYKLILQDDMNLALYDHGAVAWVLDYNTPYTYQDRNPNSDLGNCFYTQGSAIMMDQIRKRSVITTRGVPLGSEEGAPDRMYLQLQNDGNVVLVDAVPLWANNAAIPISYDQPSITIPPGTSLEPGKLYGIGNVALVFQGDGNLVVYGPNSSVIWASYSQNKGGTKCIMQGDGNLVIYTDNNVAIWHTHTGGNPDLALRVQANGRMSIVKELPVWARFGYVPTVKPRRPVFYPDHGTGDLPTYGSWTWNNVL